jgi:TrmH family RNA methyltransferase
MPTFRKLEGQHHPLARRVRRLVRSGELIEAASDETRSGDSIEFSAGGAVLLETPRLIEDALANGVPISALLVRSNAKARFEGLATRLPAATALYEVAPAVFDSLVTTETSPGLLALAEPPSWRPEDLFPSGAPALLLVLAGLQDPGNLGSILRAAEGFRATGVLLAPGTVSPYNAKALRATAGAIFRIPILRGLTAGDILSLLRRKRVKLFTTVVSGGSAPARADFSIPLAVVLGSEAAGIPPDLLDAGAPLTIPLAPHAESLNVASAASVLLYEIARQRSEPLP